MKPGRVIEVPDEARKAHLPDIVTAQNIYSDRKYVCIYEFDELTSVCPTTRLPDFYKLLIVYEPHDRVPELKSLKLYLAAFREVEVFHEHLANRITDDFVKSVKPSWVFVELRVNNRGGILTTVRRYWSKKGGDAPEEALRFAQARRSDFSVKVG